MAGELFFLNCLYFSQTLFFRLLMLLCIVAAQIISNLPFVDYYESFIETHAGFVFGEWSLKISVRHLGTHF